MQERSTRNAPLPEAPNGLRTRHPFRMWDAIMETPDAVRHCLQGATADAASRAGRVLAERGIRRAFLLGCGTSNYAAISAAYALTEIAGIDADPYDAFEFSRYRLGTTRPGTAAVSFSHSGATRVTVDAARMVRKVGALTIALTDIEDSLLARECDLLVPVGGGREPVEPKTRSYVNTVVAAYQVAVAAREAAEGLAQRTTDGLAQGTTEGLAEGATEGLAEGVTDRLAQRMTGRFAQVAVEDAQHSACERVNLYRQALARIPGALEACQPLEEPVRALAEKYARVKRVFAVGGGSNYATALEIALKFKEAVLLAGEGFEVEEAFHGPIASLGEDTLVIGVSVPGPSYEKVGHFLKAATLMGNPAVCVTSRPYDLRGVDTIKVDVTGIPEVFSNSILVYPLYMLAYYSALARGNNPDAFRPGDETFHDAMAAVPSVTYKY